MSAQPPDRYGLRLPTKSPAANPSSVVKVASIFDENDETLPKSTATRDPTLSSASTIQQRLIERQQLEALSEDPNVYAFDEVYDDIRSRSHSRYPAGPSHAASARVSGAARPAPQYVDALLKRAEERKAESERIRIRKYQRESAREASRAENPSLPADEPIITDAYRRKLEEYKRQMEQEAKNPDEDITKQADMSAFYSNLMKRNIAFGGAVEKRSDKETTTRPSQPESGKEIATPKIPSTVQKRPRPQLIDDSLLDKKETLPDEPAIDRSLFAKHTTEDAAQSARERYLARKKAKQDAQQT